MDTPAAIISRVETVLPWGREFSSRPAVRYPGPVRVGGYPDVIGQLTLGFSCLVKAMGWDADHGVVGGDVGGFADGLVIGFDPGVCAQG
jgi:hypothetical protein